MYRKVPCLLSSATVAAVRGVKAAPVEQELERIDSTRFLVIGYAVSRIKKGNSDMQIHRALILSVIVLAAAGCSEAPENRALERKSTGALADFAAADQMVAQKASNPFLALTHNFHIRHTENDIRERFEATVALCGQEDFFGCTLVDASLNEGRHYPSANIQLRIRSQGLAQLVAAAAEGGEIAAQNSRAEDLTEAVMDTDTRLEMLRSYRERLQALESRAQDDIDALIKVSSELARVQSDIERMEGSRNTLQRRLDLDLVNIHLYADEEDNYMAPLSRALDGFVYNLSSGVSGLITTLAFTLPWAIALLLVFTVLRWLWRRRRA